MSHTFTITISDDEYKAFTLVVDDPDKWVEHAVKDKLRRCGVRIVEMHMLNVDAYLAPEDKQEIMNVMSQNGDTLKKPSQWSVATLREIVARTSMPPKAERNDREGEPHIPLP